VRHDRRRTRLLWRRKTRGHARCRTSPAQRPQQSGGEFSPTDPTTRADHEALQIRATSSAISFSPWPDQQSLSSSTQNIRQNHRLRRNLAFQVWAYVSGVAAARVLGLGLEDAVPDAKTLWLYREALAKAGAVEELFDLFDEFLKNKGYLARGGQIIDATTVSVPKQHNSREDKGGQYFVAEATRHTNPIFPLLPPLANARQD
jgi:hypothetical protein